MVSFTPAYIKGNGETSWFRANGVCAGVLENGMDSECVVVLLNDVVDFGSVSFTILLVKFKFSRVKVLL